MGTDIGRRAGLDRGLDQISIEGVVRLWLCVGLSE